MTMQETSPAPAEVTLDRHCPLVSCGQEVVRGERIATASRPGAGDIHAPFPGKVLHVDPYRIRIARQEGKTVAPAVLDGLSGPELLTRLRELGADIPACAQVDTLIINGVDEEPGLRSRRTLLAEQLDTLCAGAEALVRGFVPVDAVLAVAGGVRESLPDMTVKVVSDQYPQGLDPLVAKTVTGIEAPDHTLVVGLETVFHAGLVMKTGLPVMQTMVTVDNTARLIDLGVPVGEILTTDGGTIRDGDRIVLGGVLRGRAAASPTQGVDRATTCVSLVRNPAPVAMDAPCVGCGECVRRCPARLDPAMITSYAEFGQYAKAEAEAVDACFECGLCGYFCIARRPMLQYIRLAKSELAKAKAQSGEETQP
ncbi:4Fe-4S dicluster domain-containing protein [Desulfovibrio sp. Huiquan2017]|uniref:4Fe-4S dicluster domain-containing protein n=1 Tax=Desulfovibrio sp. Huiquan2017 TaxID=2816861 RepID=UPI001A91A247|nr:4Fe-4S dicluster domain-containing protein [Desulfovibrio sp. Huiquan2017]